MKKRNRTKPRHVILQCESQNSPANTGTEMGLRLSSLNVIQSPQFAENCASDMSSPQRATPLLTDPKKSNCSREKKNRTQKNDVTRRKGPSSSQRNHARQSCVCESKDNPSHRNKTMLRSTIHQKLGSDRKLKHSSTSDLSVHCPKKRAVALENKNKKDERAYHASRIN